MVIFDELGRKNILILIQEQEESAQEKAKMPFLVPNRGLIKKTRNSS